MIVFLLLIIMVLIALLAYAGVRIEWILKTHEDGVDHAKCMSHVAHYVGNSFAASVLEAAAEEYSSAEGQHKLKVIVQSGQYVEDGPKIPSLWMLNRARDLRNEVQS